MCATYAKSKNVGTKHSLIKVTSLHKQISTQKDHIHVYAKSRRNDTTTSAQVTTHMIETEQLHQKYAHKHVCPPLNGISVVLGVKQGTVDDGRK